MPRIWHGCRWRQPRQWPLHTGALLLGAAAAVLLPPSEAWLTLPALQRPHWRAAGERSAWVAQQRRWSRLRRAAALGPSGGERPVLVLGGGIIGVSVAYYLAQRGVASTVVDHAGIASCASGKAGGFLARHWLDSGPLRELAQKSFDMHAELAKELGLASYRRLSCKAVTVAEQPPQRRLAGLQWASELAVSARAMGDEGSLAQVHPKELTEALWKAAGERGCRFQKGTVNELLVADGGRVLGALINGEEVHAGKVVMCMGPWAQVLNEALPELRIYGVKSHSVLLKTEQAFSEALFFKGLGNPEIYPRSNGENYVTGFPDPAVVVNEPPGNVQVREAVSSRLEAVARHVAPELRAGEVVARQACYLPWTGDEFPAMGRLPKHSGAYVCAGHGCWGILNSLASGLAMSELILDGKASSLDLAPFDPQRLLAFGEPSWAPSS